MGIQRIIDKYSVQTTGMLGVGFKHMATGEECYFHADEIFPAASTFKVPVLIELFNQAGQGKLSLDMPMTLRQEDKALGSGMLRRFSPGVVMPLRDYALLMMIVSDNTATDRIVDLLGKDAIADMIAQMGLENTRVQLNCNQLILNTFGLPGDIPTSQAGSHPEYDNWQCLDPRMYAGFDTPNDITSPRDMVRMLELIYTGRAVSPEASRQMVDIMAQCQSDNRLTALMPDGDIRVAHKTGMLEYVSNDCGIFFTPGHDYILAVFYNGFFADEAEKAEARKGKMQNNLIARLSLEIYEHLHK